MLDDRTCVKRKTRKIIVRLVNGQKPCQRPCSKQKLVKTVEKFKFSFFDI